ncbi:MAG: FG-GAP-like repeat-containing protein [Planctomycetota bacterium]
MNLHERRPALLLFVSLCMLPVAADAQIFPNESIVDTAVGYPADAVSGDFNNDGAIDLVVIEGSSGNLMGYVYPGAPGLGFGPRVPLDLSQLPAPARLLVGDFVTDGFVDIVVFDTISGATLLFPNLGALTFGPPILGSGSGFTTDAVAADFNGDGALDYLTPLTIAQAGAIRYGDGVGGFSAGPVLPMVGFPRAVTLGDLNGDGAVDLVFGMDAGGGGGFQVRLNDGFGSWPTTTFLGGTQSATSLLPGDYNNDGHLDIAGTTVGFNAVFLALGDGLGGLSVVVNQWVGSEAFGGVSADFNSDGNLDVAVFPSVSEIQLYSGDGLGALTLAETIPTTGAPLQGVAEDLDGDGDYDIATTSIFQGQVGRVAFYENSTLAGGTAFVRGDANVDGTWNLADPIKVLGFLFSSEPLDCESAADANDDEGINLADVVYSLTQLFASGPPFPTPTTCGTDPTSGSLSCAGFAACP